MKRLTKLLAVSIGLIISGQACAMKSQDVSEIAEQYERNCKIIGVDPSISLRIQLEAASTNELVNKGAIELSFSRALDFVDNILKRIEKAKQKKSYVHAENVEKGWFADTVLIVDCENLTSITGKLLVERIIRAYRKTHYKYPRIYAAATLGLTSLAVIGYCTWKILRR